MPPVDSQSRGTVTILGRPEPSWSELRAKQIAEYLGADVKTIDLGECTEPDQESGGTFLVDMTRLAEAAEQHEGGLEGALRILDSASKVFIYGFEPLGLHDRILQALLGGGTARVEPLPIGAAGTFRIADSQRGWFGPFAGLTVEGAKAGWDVRFAGDVSRGVSLIELDGAPFFLSVTREKSTYFLAGICEIADLNEVIAYKRGLLPWFSRLVPLLSFIKAALGDACWHSDRAQACIIIDDPLLKRRYGFLNFERLLKELHSQRFSASIGFIPWNYRRTSSEVAEMFRQTGQTLSICVHGCDHTGAEFGGQYDVMRSKASLALERMRRHCELSGVPFDNVMVFPQGVFSIDAMRALGDCGYLAAVNTELCPPDCEQSLPIGRLMDVALSIYGDVPLFGRHYPVSLAEFAFDLFLGKPAFVVEHHGFFQGGYERMRRLVEDLNRLDERLEWDSPAAVCSRASLKRSAPGGVTEVRFYTDRHLLENRSDQTSEYVLRRRLSTTSKVSSVTVNGTHLNFERTGSDLEFRVTLPSGGNAYICISRTSDGVLPPVDTTWHQSFKYHAGVLARRLLSELRDDYVATSPKLSSTLERLCGL